MPKKTKYRKKMKGRMKGHETRGTKLEFGNFGLVACDPAWITSRQIEAARRAMTRNIKRGGNVWIKILIFIHSFFGCYAYFFLPQK